MTAIRENKPFNEVERGVMASVVTAARRLERLTGAGRILGAYYDGTLLGNGSFNIATDAGGAWRLRFELAGPAVALEGRLSGLIARTKRIIMRTVDSLMRGICYGSSSRRRKTWSSSAVIGTGNTCRSIRRRACVSIPADRPATSMRAVGGNRTIAATIIVS